MQALQPSFCFPFCSLIPHHQLTKPSTINPNYPSDGLSSVPQEGSAATGCPLPLPAECHLCRPATCPGTLQTHHQCSLAAHVVSPFVTFAQLQAAYASYPRPATAGVAGEVEAISHAVGAAVNQDPPTADQHHLLTLLHRGLATAHHYTGCGRHGWIM